MKTPIRIGITMGDTNGIGPEVALKATLKQRWPTDVQIILIGSAPYRPMAGGQIRSSLATVVGCR